MFIADNMLFSIYELISLSHHMSSGAVINMLIRASDGAMLPAHNHIGISAQLPVSRAPWEFHKHYPTCVHIPRIEVYVG